MISVGIDVSKGKSTVCILRPNEGYVCKLFELLHCKEDLELLDALLKKLYGEVKVVMEATGIYNLPILTFLVEKRLEVFSIISLVVLLVRYLNIKASDEDRTVCSIIMTNLHRILGIKDHEGFCQEELRNNTNCCSSDISLYRFCFYCSAYVFVELFFCL